MAKLIPANKNTENPTQSINLIGKNFFIQTSTFIPQVLTPCLKMDYRSKVAGYLEVWGTDFFIKPLLVIQKGLKLAMSFIYFHPNCVLSIGITYSVDSFQGQV